MERFLVKHLPALSAHCRAMAIVGLDPTCAITQDEPRWPGCVMSPGDDPMALEARAAAATDLPEVLDELLADMGSASNERLVSGLLEMVRAIGVLGDLEQEPEPERVDEADPAPEAAPDAEPDAELEPDPELEPDAELEPDPDPQPEPEPEAATGLVLRGLAAGAQRGVVAVEGETGQGRLRAVILWDDGARSQELGEILESAQGWLAHSARRHYLFLMEREAGQEERVYALSLGLDATRQNTNVPGLVRWRLSVGAAQSDTRPPPVFPPGPPSCLRRDEVVADLVQAMILLENPPPPRPCAGPRASASAPPAWRRFTTGGWPSGSGRGVTTSAATPSEQETGSSTRSRGPWG